MLLFIICPQFFSLFIIILIWSVIPYYSLLLDYNLGGVFFFCCTRFGVYTLIGRGWSSNSNYALLGAIRGVAQTISYEVRIALIFLSFIFIIGSFNLFRFNKNQDIIWLIFIFYPLFFLLINFKFSWNKSNTLWFCWGWIWISLRF